MKTLLCFLPAILLLAGVVVLLALVPQPLEKEIDWTWKGWIDDPAERSSGFPYPTATLPPDHPLNQPTISNP